jgi:hypothetical protein
MHYFQLYFDKELYVFRTHLLSIIKRIDTEFIATGICNTGYVDCLVARSGVPSCPRYQTVNIANMTNINCCEYRKSSILTSLADSQYS